LYSGKSVFKTENTPQKYEHPTNYLNTPKRQFKLETGEYFEHSIPSCEKELTQVQSQSLVHGLSTGLFDAAPVEVVAHIQNVLRIFQGGACLEGVGHQNLRVVIHALGLQTSTRSVCLNFEGKNDDSSAFSTSINGHSSGFPLFSDSSVGLKV
jgi:hypothetical protein